MRLSHLFSVAATVLLLPGAVVAEESLESTITPGPDAVQTTAADAPGGDLADDQLGDPEIALGLDESLLSEEISEEVSEAISEEDVVLESLPSSENPDAWVLTTVESAPATVTDSGVVL